MSITNKIAMAPIRFKLFFISRFLFFIIILYFYYDMKGFFGKWCSKGFLFLLGGLKQSFGQQIATSLRSSQ